MEFQKRTRERQRAWGEDKQLGGERRTEQAGSEARYYHEAKGKAKI